MALRECKLTQRYSLPEEENPEQSYCFPERTINASRCSRVFLPFSVIVYHSFFPPSLCKECWMHLCLRSCRSLIFKVETLTGRLKSVYRAFSWVFRCRSIPMVPLYARVMRKSLSSTSVACLSSMCLSSSMNGDRGSTRKTKEVKSMETESVGGPPA